MKTFISDIFPKLQRFSEELNNLTLLSNQHWVSIDNILTSKTIYIFRNNNDLLISNNGKVEKGKWEYLGNNSLLIDKGNESYLFKQGFFDENVLALKVDGNKEYAVFVNENKYNGELNSIEKVIDFLKQKYLDKSQKANLEIVTGFELNNKIVEKKEIIVLSEEDIEKQKKLDEESELEERNMYRWIIILLSLVTLVIIIIQLAK